MVSHCLQDPGEGWWKSQLPTAPRALLCAPDDLIHLPGLLPQALGELGPTCLHGALRGRWVEAAALSQSLGSTPIPERQQGRSAGKGLGSQG